MTLLDSTLIVLASIAAVIGFSVALWSLFDTRRRHYKEHLSRRNRSAQSPENRPQDPVALGGSALGIKSFLYLDEYKMYSISSQLFGGLTEYLIDYQGTTKKTEEKQGGPPASGRVMADILKSESMTQQRKYLHDYSYTLLERRLEEGDKVLSVSSANIDDSIRRISDVAFVKIKAKAVFNDMEIIKATMEEFNDLGEALAYITNFDEIQKVSQQLDTLEGSIKDRNQRARLRKSQKALTNIENIASSKGLRQDPTFLQNLRLILDYGFQDQFEVQMTVGAYTFSANLKRDYLREDVRMLVRKYSRFSESDFVLLGTIAQSPAQSADSDSDDESVQDSNPQHLKQAIMRIVEGLSEVESSFSGKLANETIIDPIAVYREI